MSSAHVSRRGFLSSLIGSTTASSGWPNVAAPILPDQAWVIVAQNWHHNDEFYLAEGEHIQSELYYSETEAQVKCRQLCMEFYEQEPPSEYIDVLETFLESGMVDPEQVTWEQLCAAGYAGPYRVQPLHLPQRKPPT